jgi:hypothetical protein
MKILNPVLVVFFSIFLLAGMSFSVVAEESEATSGMATVVVLRAQESAKTRGVSFNVFINNEDSARMRVANHYVVNLPAGEHKISSNNRKDVPMTFDTVPGETYYIIAKMQKRGSQLKTTYELVSERVALNSLPSLSDELDG